jgi:hypothetical protein
MTPKGIARAATQQRPAHLKPSDLAPAAVMVRRTPTVEEPMDFRLQWKGSGTAALDIGHGCSTRRPNVRHWRDPRRRRPWE